MPKSLMIRPADVRKRGYVELDPIPVNQYSRTMADELDRYSREDLIRIYHDMAVIRAFETMLNEVKQQREYKGVSYDHRGPAHLSIGQEASAVGQAFLLSVEDHIFGSHRSHGEILAKGLSAITKLPDADLTRIMRLTTWYTAHWRRSSGVSRASIKAWAAPCTPSSTRSVSTRTMP
jgi:2-oxoisovalerate dehydrogenase E1 component